MGNGVLYIWWVLSLITVGYLPNCSLSLSNLVGFLFLLLLLLFVCIIVITSYDHVPIIFHSHCSIICAVFSPTPGTWIRSSCVSLVRSVSVFDCVCLTTFSAMTSPMSRIPLRYVMSGLVFRSYLFFCRNFDLTFCMNTL